MKLYLYITSVLLTVLSCSKKSCSYAIIGGEIINKNTNYVVLLNNKEVIDTLALDGKNRFSYKLKNLDSGFYTFQHGNEIQKVLLEPGDSVMFRLNTLEFDESLVYTGKGAKKNNYLINDFLQNELEEKQVYKFCALSPLDYQSRMDSIRLQKNEKLKEFQLKQMPSDLFNKIAQANIDFSYYASKEIYPFIHKGRGKEKKLVDIPDGFYDYRKMINYNDDYLANHFAYKSFLKSSFNNIALADHLEHADNGYVWTNCCYNLDRLTAIDSLVQNASIKNELLYYYSMHFLRVNKDIKNNAKIVNYFLSKSTNEENNTSITAYNNSINKLRPGATFPSVELRSIKDSIVNISSIIDQPTVVYFWSHNYKNYLKDSRKRVKELNVKYPEVNFISVNIDDFNKSRWVSTMQAYKHISKHDYAFVNPKESVKQLAVYPVTKAILVDKEHVIINSNANMFSKNFEEELLGLVNQF